MIIKCHLQANWWLVLTTYKQNIYRWLYTVTYWKMTLFPPPPKKNEERGGVGMREGDTGLMELGEGVVVRKVVLYIIMIRILGYPVKLKQHFYI